MNEFKIGACVYKTKKEAIIEYRRLSHSSYLTFNDCCKIIALAEYKEGFTNKIKIGISDVISDNGLWVVLVNGERIRVPFCSLIDAAYRRFKPNKNELEQKGMRHFKKACKLLVRRVSMKTILKFIEIHGLTPRKTKYVEGEKGIYIFIDKELEREFKRFAKVYDVHTYQNFYRACRQSVLSQRPSEKGKQAHHANEGGFVKIVKDFIEERHVDLNEVYFYPVSEGAKFADSRLRRDFINYHRQRVVWQLVSPSEHESLHAC